jgi:hypothetical protein
VRLLLGAAESVHRWGDLLATDQRFPSEALVEPPLHEDAVRYLRRGPPWLTQRKRHRIACWYATLQNCDLRLDTMTPEAVDVEIARLRALRHEIDEVTHVPPLLMGEFYNLKLHIDLVLRRLEARRRRAADDHGRLTRVDNPAERQRSARCRSSEWVTSSSRCETWPRRRPSTAASSG